MCPACNNHNHAHRTACFRCSLPRPASAQRYGSTPGAHEGMKAARGGGAVGAGAADAMRRVTLFKKDASERTGIRLGGAVGAPTILSLSQGGVGKKRHLEVGERIVAINGEQVDGHEHGTQLLRAAVGKITLEVTPADEGGDLADADRPPEPDAAHSWQAMLQTAGQANQGGGAG